MSFSGITKKSNIFGALIGGKKLYCRWHGSLNTLAYLAFLAGFVKQLPKAKYVFLFDNASYHKSSTILKYLQGLGDDIKVEFIPPYSPELNPTETCWKVIRHNVTNSTFFQSIEEMQIRIERFLAGHNFDLNPSNHLCR